MNDATECSERVIATSQGGGDDWDKGHMNRRVRFWLVIAFGVATALAVSGWILRAIFEVQHGRGAETFIGGKGLQVHWVDVLTMFFAVIVAILAMLIATMIVTCRKKRDLALTKKEDSGDGT